MKRTVSSMAWRTSRVRRGEWGRSERDKEGGGFSPGRAHQEKEGWVSNRSRTNAYKAK